MVSKIQHATRSECPLACALDLIGDHWTLLVVRDMIMFNRHEYREFLAGDEGISSNILSDRLAKLEANGLVDSMPHPESRKRKLYYLTPRGKDLVHVLIAIGRWSATHLGAKVTPPADVLVLVDNDPKKINDPKVLAAALLKRLEHWEASVGLR